MYERRESRRTNLRLDNLLESPFIDWKNVPTRQGQDLYDAVKPFSHIILKLLTEYDLDMWDKIPAIDKPLEDKPNWIYK